MISLQLPDWRDIGRDIGKRLRDLLPPSRDSGPSPEERLAKRKRDVLKGFAYFDTIDEVLAWNAEEVDPLQKANTPILCRPSIEDSWLGLKAKVILCHDYKGGYHDYESVCPEPLMEEMYSCEYLQYVDSFIYFSHKMVCIPPPIWTNTLHRNGVKVLATFIIEPQTPNVNRILTKKDGDYVLATTLANMARTFGFDGWLLNIEKSFTTNVTEEIIAFIECLKNRLGSSSEVVWYDALNIENKVKYQNGLTEENLPFANAADALFTNYKWTEAKLLETKQIAFAHGLNPSRIVFGIDVWAQNTDMPGPPRVTFPKDGGGGTNTGLAINTLREHGFRAAVFGPAWAYEHFPTTSANASQQHISKSVDTSLWDGVRLLDDLQCDCKKGKPHHTATYQLHPISRHAFEFPAGSSTYLDSDFGRAFSEGRSENGQRLLCPTLGTQAILPRLKPLSVNETGEGPGRTTAQVIYGVYENVTNNMPKLRSLLTIYVKATVGESSEDNASLVYSESKPTLASVSRLCLYTVCMPTTDGLSVRIVSFRPRESRSFDTGLYAAIKSDKSSDLHYEYHKLLYTSSTMSDTCIKLARNPPGSTLVEVGVYCRDGYESPKPMRLLQIMRFSVMPSAIFDGGCYDFVVANLRLISRGDPPNDQKRLAWDWHGTRDAWPTILPWSGITGPFSHFTVSVGGSEVGQSHALEYPLEQEDLEKDRMTRANITTTEASYSVRGHCFGGLPLKRSAVDTELLSD